MTVVVTRWRFWHAVIRCLALAIGAGVLAGACGGDGSAAPSSPPPTTPAPPPTPPPPPPPPPPTCTVGLVLRAGDSCIYPGTAQTFTVNADGSATFGFITSSTSINISSNNLTFIANRQSDGSWILERVGTESRNRAPVAVGNIPDQTLTEGGSTRTVDVSASFADPDGDALTYGASSNLPSVARVSVAGSDVTLTPVAAGTAAVTVTATDPGGQSATQRFDVTVNEDPGTTTDTFRAGDRIPDFPTGIPNTLSGANFSLSGGMVIITMQRGGYVQYGDVRYTCNAAQCQIEDGLVTAGVIERTVAGDGGGGVGGEGDGVPKQQGDPERLECGPGAGLRDPARGAGSTAGHGEPELERGPGDRIVGRRPQHPGRGDGPEPRGARLDGLHP